MRSYKLTEVKRTALTTIIFIFGLWFMVGCKKTLNEQSKFPEFSYINEYIMNADDIVVALVISPETYSERIGLELSQIVVYAPNLEKPLQESGVYTDFFPWNLQWLGKEHLLFLQKDPNTKKVKLVNWDLESDQKTKQLFSYSGFSISNNEEQLVSWGALGEGSDGSINEIYDGQLDFYTVPHIEYSNNVALLSDDELKIHHVEWAEDDQSLLIMSQLANESELSIFWLDLESGEQKGVLEEIPRTSQFTWNSSKDLLAFANLTDPYALQIFDISKGCFIFEDSQKGRAYSIPTFQDDHLTVTVSEKNVGYWLIEIPYTEFENNICIE